VGEKTIIEVRGMKLEVDLSTAKRIDMYAVGDNVKVLLKSYGDVFKSYAGVIVGFDNFKELPTIVVAYLKNDYSTALVEFAYLNSQSKDIEICHMTDAEKMLDKASAVDALDREINKKKVELMELEARKSYFITNFKLHFDKILTKGGSPGVLE